MSLSYISLHDKFGKLTRPLFSGGMLPDDNEKDSADMMSMVLGDANFPLFERRSIRDDPICLRHSFPVQAVGIKLTADMGPDVSDSSTNIYMHCLSV